MVSMSTRRSHSEQALTRRAAPPCYEIYQCSLFNEAGAQMSSHPNGLAPKRPPSQMVAPKLRRSNVLAPNTGRCLTKVMNISNSTDIVIRKDEKILLVAILVWFWKYQSFSLKPWFQSWVETAKHPTNELEEDFEYDKV